MIRTIYVVTEFSQVKCICEAKEDAQKLAEICGENAAVEVAPYFPAYGYMKLGSDIDAD